MAKKAKGADVNLYYMKNGQVNKEIDSKSLQRKKNKEREKRLKQNNQNKEDDFDLETETVIQMTNKNKIKKEEEKRKRLTKEEQKRKKRNKKIKFVLKIILLIGIISGGIAFALISPIFNIKDIQVTNNSQLSSEAIISLSEIKTEENIFRFSALSSANKIKENPYIEEVKIHRKIPNTIQIEVTERIPKYCVGVLGTYAYINTQGYILEISEDNKNLPILQGIKTTEENIIPNNRLETSDLERLEDVIKIMNIFKENNLDEKVTSIDISNKNEYSLYIEEEQKKIYLGDSSNLSNKMLYVLSIIEEEKGKAGDIYVNGDLNNKFRPYFRQKVN